MENEIPVSDTLAARCRRGDRAAARLLYERYADAMYNVCLRIMNNRTDAEDMLQEGFYQVFKNIESYRGEATIGAWIKRIVINRCLNEVKKKTRYFIEADDIELKEDDPIDENAFTYTVESIKKAIQRLPDGYRVVLTLYLFEDFSHKEIAEKLAVSVSTVKTQYMRAKQKVREMVRGYGNQ